MRYTYLVLVTLSTTACTNRVVVGVTDGGGDSNSDNAVACGDSVCPAGARCCDACPGGASVCASEDLACPALSCSSTCGGEVCATGEECCTNGCGANGFACSDGPCEAIDCPTDSFMCDGSPCEGSAPACCEGCGGQPSTCAPAGMCPPSACPPGDICGGEVCAGGTTCCRRGCGPNDSQCIDDSDTCELVACMPECDAMDVLFVGGCEPAPRWWFDGETCVSGTGCSCEGADCDRTYSEQRNCLGDFGGCLDS